MSSAGNIDLATKVLRQAEASAYAENIEEPAVRRAVQFALFRAIARFMRWEGQSDDDYVRQLPPMPFDALFFVEIAKDVFSHKKRVQRLLNGEIVDDFDVD